MCGLAIPVSQPTGIVVCSSFSIAYGLLYWIVHFYISISLKSERYRSCACWEKSKRKLYLSKSCYFFASYL